MTAPTKQVRAAVYLRDGFRCAAPGCDRGDKQGPLYCRMHYHRMRRTGSLDARPQRPARGICIVEGCGTLDAGPAGYCDRHLTRVRRHGAPDVVLTPPGLPLQRNPRWVGEDASYWALHQRMRKAKGNARDHACIDCGERAAHWSYNNSGIQERLADNGSRYSLDVEQYEPRCVSCHSRFDRDARASQ